MNSDCLLGLGHICLTLYKTNTFTMIMINPVLLEHYTYTITFYNKYSFQYNHSFQFISTLNLLNSYRGPDNMILKRDHIIRPTGPINLLIKIFHIKCLSLSSGYLTLIGSSQGQQINNKNKKTNVGN